MGGKMKAPILRWRAVDHGSSDSDDNNGEDKGGFDLGLPLEKLNLGSKKKLLVICLGGLLVHRVHHRELKPNYREPDIVAGNFLLFKRTHFYDFVNFCFERFHVGLWSSAKEWNVDYVLNAAMRGLKDRLIFVWDQDECTDSGFNSLEKEDKPIFLKELKKVWNNPARLKGRDRFSSSNTLMMDDEPYKALLNPPDTAIFPSSYKADHGSDNVLGPRGELRKFLDGLSDAEDVPSYVKNNPIGQPAITEEHPDWDFYSKISAVFIRSVIS